MTFDYNKLSKKPGLFRNFTGFSQNEFDDIYRVIEERNDEFEKERLDRRDRKRSIGGGRKFKLVLRERFLMPANTKCLWPQNQRFCGLLVYYRLYITYALVGFLFDVDQSTVWRDIRHLEPLVKECIPIPKKMEDKMRKIGEIDELLKMFPDMEAFVDATEQEIPRPKDKQKRKDFYSGKKKRHTIKTQIVNKKNGLIVPISKSVEGKKHDYTLFKEQSPPIPQEIERYVDLGYLGIEKDFPELKVKIPYKKLKGEEISEDQKKYNKKLRSKRVVSEHTIGKMKKYGIMGSKFRNRYERYDTMTSIVGGFVNFRIMNSCTPILKV